MKNKRAQITIFIIIAILLIAIVALFFLFKGGQSKDELVNPEIEAISNFVGQCIYETGETAIYDVSFTGGYFLPPELSNDLGIPYYYYNNRNYVPTKEKVAEQISLALDSSLVLCLSGLENFTGYEISFKNPRTKATIENESVLFDVRFPVTIKKENSATLIENFDNIKIPVRLGVVYNSISGIISEQTSDGICLSCATDIATENDLHIEIVDYDDETAIFNITDENSQLQNKTLGYIFAVKY